MTRSCWLRTAVSRSCCSCISTSTPR
jgi:hypothetical protein